MGMQLIDGDHVEPQEVKPQLDDILGRIEQFGVVHGDIKSNNVLLDKEIKVWLIDFGLSKIGIKRG
ncbi:hypothetical protein MIR68_011096 [Amoeboaphelidium protococcarum]|nr:hypothetical protein MIR68_011096 [Amoeboaphelidium protococcarum]